MHIKQTRKWFAEHYGMDRRWITKQLSKIGVPKRAGALLPIEVEMLRKRLGEPIKS